jgi:hypothetical protein
MIFNLGLIIWLFHWVRPKLFLRLWYFQRKPCTYLAPTLTLSRNGPKWDSTWPTSPRSCIRCVQNIFEPMVCLAQTVHLSCVKKALSPNGPKRVSTWASSPRSTIRCIQNNLRAYGTLAQTVHLSYTDTNVVSKRTEIILYMNQVTYEIHQVRP